MKTSNKIGIVTVAIYLAIPLIIMGISWFNIASKPYDIDEIVKQLERTKITTINLHGVELQEIGLYPSSDNFGWIMLRRIPDMVKIEGETLHITLNQPSVLYDSEHMRIKGVKYAILNGKKYEIEADTSKHTPTNVKLIPIDDNPQAE